MSVVVALPKDVVVLARPHRAGLANKLFPWARAVVHAELAQIPMAPTSWAQLLPRQLLRRDLDKRTYRDQFRPEPWAVKVSPVHLAMLPWRPEPVRLGAPEPRWDGGLQVFRGLADYFGRLTPHRQLVRNRLLEIARLTDPGDEPKVMLHVRRGDFPIRLQTPINWYLDVVAALRKAGYDGQVGFVSDCGTSDRQSLLAIGAVDRTSTSAVADLVRLASARMIIASGHSTFSSWATYLGRGTTIYPEWLNLTGLESSLSERVFAIGALEPNHVGRLRDVIASFSSATEVDN